MSDGPAVVRRNAPARHGKDVYEDTGCKLAPKCLECPLERCYHDVGGSGELRRRKFLQRAPEARRLRDTGLTKAEIGRQMGVSPQTVRRLLSEGVMPT